MKEKKEICQWISECVRWRERDVGYSVICTFKSLISQIFLHYLFPENKDNKTKSICLKVRSFPT